MTTKLTITIPVWLDRIFAWPVVWYRKHKYGWPFRRIPLGEGKFTIVDPDVYYEQNNFNWCVSGQAGKEYAVRFDNSSDKRKIISLHGQIMKPPAGLLVDHKNRNSLDNRIDNLRIATHSENQYNRGKIRTKTSSQYIGVYFDKITGRWGARTHYKGEKIWLGRFDDEVSAAKAYDEAARKYHGEFARLNFDDKK